MNVRLHNKSVTALLLLTVLFGGCSMSDEHGDGSDSPQTGKSFVSLTFTMSTKETSRANPTGGEDGDGTEKGQEYENAITDAVAFLYQDNNGVNGDGTATVTPVYFSRFTHTEGDGTGIDRVYTTEPHEVDLEAGTYQVLAVANPGDYWWVGKTTLAEIRDYVQTSAWTESDGSYSDFLMTSEKNATITITDASTKESPAKAEVNVERMAARIDYAAKANYTCTDPTYTGATVKITGACIVNNLTAGSYLMKRVAETVNGNVTYLGEETATNGEGTNYVIDPWTTSKTEENLTSGFTINGISGKDAKDLYGTYWDDTNASNPNWWASKATTGTSLTIGGETWNRIGYTLENTTDATETSKQYNTAVVFKAQFNPSGLSNYTEGNTFFARGDRLFASMEDMMADVYGQGIATFDNSINACTTWGNVQDFANTLLENDPSGYKAFLEKQLADKTSTATITNDERNVLLWANYMKAECGYSATLDNNAYQVTIDQNEKVTAEILAQYGTRTYEDATCYYTWWVRHANDNEDTTNGVMEFAIVRNNIYKLTVSSIYSLGGYIPGDENIVIDAYVKDWTLVDEEELEM